MPTTYAIPNGRTVFDATLYTGTGSNVAISNASTGTQGFQPDLVWIKVRAYAYDHDLFDSVRGPLKILVSNNYNAQDTQAAGKTLTAFNTNGFQLGTDNSSSGTVNNTNWTYVGWNWKAGGTAVSNTAGSITSQVSANTTSGFSVVQYTGNSSSAQTIGHGLGVAPSMIIAKCATQGSTNWVVYHSSISNPVTNFLLLNDVGGTVSISNYWSSSQPTSTVFGVAGGGYDNNQNGQTQIAYCWAQVAGYSQFGKYTGNGSTDGPFIYTGFRPKFVMFKRTDAAGSWHIFDSSINSYNAATLNLYPNAVNAETANNTQDLLSNGFKCRSTDSDTNTSGGTYVYAAFAENPFKYANAR